MNLYKLADLYYKLAVHKLKMLEQAPTAISSEVCSKCGGKCCQTLPGMTLPSQWGSDRSEIKQNIEAAVQSKEYTFDIYEDFEPSYHKIYYVRPAIAGRDRLIDTSYEGTCSMLTPEGCKLDHEHRPFECQSLMPSELGAGHCKPSSSRQAMIDAWKPYQDLIKHLIRRINPHLFV